MTTDEEIMARIEKSLENIIMHSRILQLYKTPGMSFKDIREMEAKIMADYANKHEM